jgi:hypothetical protein
MRKPPDYLLIASTTASVCFKTSLSAEELRRVLLTGEVPADRRPHVGALLEEAPKVLLDSLFRQMCSSMARDQLDRNLTKIAPQVGLPPHFSRWATDAQSPGEGESDAEPSP